MAIETWWRCWRTPSGWADREHVSSEIRKYRVGMVLPSPEESEKNGEYG